MCELCLSNVAVEGYRRESRAVPVESFRKVAPRKNSTRFLLFVSFFSFFCFSLGLNLHLFPENEICSFYFMFFALVNGGQKHEKKTTKKREELESA